MNLPVLYVGTANPERDAAIAAELATMDAATVALHHGVSRTTVRAAAARHAALRRFDLWIEGSDTPPLRVCQAASCKPFTAVALAAYRAYPGTLKKLELPGWRLTDGQGACAAIADIQAALKSSAKAEREGKHAQQARSESRQRLGMEA